MTAAYTYSVVTASQAWHQETYTHHLLSSSIHNKLDTIIRSIFFKWGNKIHVVRVVKQPVLKFQVCHFLAV